MNKQEYYSLIETIKAGKEAERKFFALVYDKANKAYSINCGSKGSRHFDFIIYNDHGEDKIKFTFSLSFSNLPQTMTFSVDDFFNIDLEEEKAKKQREIEKKELKRKRAEEKEERAMLAKLKAKYESEVSK